MVISGVYTPVLAKHPNRTGVTGRIVRIVRDSETKSKTPNRAKLVRRRKSYDHRLRPLPTNREVPDLKAQAHQTARKSANRLQRSARDRADDEARRIPWQRLYDARNQYIDWQEFQLWVRSILEVGDRIPNWLAEILNDRCPGFLESEKTIPKEAKIRPLTLRLEDWIDDHIFGFAKQQGWFNAITFYAMRDPRYQRAEVCWSECVEKWKDTKPIRYPSFEEWKTMAAQCDETARSTARERKARASTKLVGPDRLATAVARYVDYEALAYWARPALERGPEPPRE
jgi:hypothetical protein